MQYRIKGHFCSWGEQRRLQERFDTENGGQSIKVCLTIAPAGASRPYVPDGESAAASLRPVGAETAGAALHASTLAVFLAEEFHVTYCSTVPPAPGPGLHRQLRDRRQSPLARCTG